MEAERLNAELQSVASKNEELTTTEELNQRKVKNLEEQVRMYTFF